MPNRLKALHRDRAAKPLLPTSIGRHLALHPACRHSLTSPSYLASFLSKASSRRSSQGTVSSNRTTCLVDSDKRTMSGLKVVVTMWLGNLSCCSRSTNSCQSLAVARMPADVFAAGLGCSPALIKVMACLEGRERLAHSTPTAMASAMAFSTWSCLHLYLPSPSAFGQQLRICSNVPRLEHSGHAGDSTLPHMWRFDGLGSTSYTAWIRNLIRCGSAFHSSAHVTFLSIAFSHRIQAPCCLIPTVLQVLSSSTTALTSSWTRRRLSFPLMVSMWGVEKEPSPVLPLATTPTSLLWSNLDCLSNSPLSLPLPTSPNFNSSLCHLWIAWVSILQHFPGSRYLELLFQGLEWQLQFVAVPIECDAA